MSNLSARIGDQRAFGTHVDYRGIRAPRVLSGLSVLLGLLVVGGGCEAGQASTSGSPAVAAADAVPAAVRQEE